MKNHSTEVAKARNEMGLSPVADVEVGCDAQQKPAKTSASWVAMFLYGVPFLVSTHLTTWLLLAAGYETDPPLFSAKMLVQLAVTCGFCLLTFGLLKYISRLFPKSVQVALQREYFGKS
ncbi:MAG TPA: hypothetical protein VL381_08955 [Rhodocyclaceae bacterium]|jgi:hypothetical protein|nr:hypothetical protein [Rhodocyclaceae bacterium]